jgi:hypothetical protein
MTEVSLIDIYPDVTRDDLMKKNVSDLDKFAVTCGFKSDVKGGKSLMPSGLRKAEKVEWLIGAIKDKREGRNVGNQLANTKYYTYDQLTPTSFPSCELSDYKQWKSYLFNIGVAVVHNVVPLDKLTDLRTKYWTWMRGCNPSNPIDPAQPDTWRYDQIHPSANGIFKTCIAQEEFMWLARYYLLDVFSAVWGTDDLVSSMDGGSLLIPSKNDKFTLWPHADQSRNNKDMCIQGILMLTDSDTQDGGFAYVKNEEYACIPFFEDYIKRNSSYGIKWGKIDPEDEMIKNSPIRKVNAPAGSVILFNSMLFHTNVPSGRAHREALYVSMQQRSLIDEKSRVQRDKAYIEGRNTGHWCYGDWFSLEGKSPNLRGGGDKKMPTHVTTLPREDPIIRLLLHGIVDEGERKATREEARKMYP